MKDLGGNALASNKTFSFTPLWTTKQLGSSSGDYANDIAIDSSGNFLTEFGGLTQSQIGGIAVDDNDGSFYVTELMQHYVKKFDSSGNFIAQQYAYANPADVAVDDSGNVYLTAKQGNGAGTHQVRIYSDFENNVLAAKIGNRASTCSIYHGCTSLQGGDFL